MVTELQSLLHLPSCSYVETMDLTHFTYKGLLCVGVLKELTGLIFPYNVLFRVSLEDLHNGKVSKLKLTKKVICDICKGYVFIIFCYF